MGFTDLFIRRPLLAWVLNALILVFGIVAFSYLELRPYPDVENATVVIATSYPGASADVVQGFVTAPLQRAVVGAEGIDYYTSSSRDGQSTITINVVRGYNTDLVVTDVIGKVASVRGELPINAMEPVISKLQGGSAPVWIQLKDPNMSFEQITELFYRVIRPSLISTEGAAGLQIIGERPFSMRLWLDPIRMAAVDVTAADLHNAIRANNFISEAGELRDVKIIQPVRAATDINTPAEFANIVIRQQDGAVVRVRDVATVELASAPLDSKGFVDNSPALLAGIQMAPDSNPMALSKNVHRVVDELQGQLPSTMSMEIFYDLSEFLDRALSQVIKTLFEALLIVALITLLFFGNPRSLLIMLVSIPLSLIGTFLIMWSMDYSLNLFTLLALVIAIGLVVDDSIVVVENIHRHIEEGMTPMEAALKGAREVIGPVIAMSLTLVAVFLPVGFMEGLSGDLIAEFVYTLAGSVVISGIVALTLSPMLCSRVLKPEGDHSIGHWLDARFDALCARYSRALHSAMEYRPLWLITALVVIAAIPVLLVLSEKELVPIEDSGYIHTAFSVPPHMSDDYITEMAGEMEKVMKSLPGSEGSLRFEGMMDDRTSMAVTKLQPWEERELTAMDLVPILQQRVNEIPGLEGNVFIIDLSPASGTAQIPIQLAVRTTESFRALSEVSNRFLEEIRDSGKFIFAANDLKYSEPQLEVEINRDLAGELGISMEDIAATLSTMLGEGYINRFNFEGESYKVVPQATANQRVDRSWIDRYYVRTGNGDSVPLGSMVQTRLTSKPRGLNQFNGLNTASISMVPSPGVSMQEAYAFLEQKKREVLPPGYSVDYSGKIRSFLQSGNTMLFVFLLALLTIYLFLVAQFESLRDPLVVLITVPMSLCGALIFLCLDFATLSLFSQVGLITLIGLISKHGILMVDFARRLQEKGVAFEEAIIEAASVRLRPILMTTAAIVMAVTPLAIASGPGAVSRNHIGIVIATGMTIGTLFTLFVLPVIYTYIAQRRVPILAGDTEPEVPVESAAAAVTRVKSTGSTVFRGLRLRPKGQFRKD